MTTTNRCLELLLFGAVFFSPGVTAFVPSLSTELGQQAPRSALQMSEPSETPTTETPSEEAPIQDEEELYEILGQQSNQAGGSSASSDASYSKIGWSPNQYGASIERITINGWSPKEDYACWGLPGAIAPLGFFDPLGFARRGTPLNDIKRLREAEVQHGRVAMLATVGYIAGEQLPSPLGITGPANDQLQQVPAPAFALLTLLIATAELYRAKVGWVEPRAKIGSGTLFTLRDSYYPGDIGFDPLNLKPTENYEFQKMQTKELSNGRLAMLAWAGMCSQELVNHKSIFGTMEFYQSL